MVLTQTERGSSSSLKSLEPKEFRPLKVFFLSSDTGGGHRASAESLGVQFETIFPGSTYSLLDLTKFQSANAVESYKHLSSHPQQWNVVYKVSNSRLGVGILKTYTKITTEKALRKSLKEADPDVVISVHPLMCNTPVYSCSKISAETGKHLPMFTVVTDLGSGHSTWFEKGVEKIFIASDSIRNIALKRGKVPANKLIMSGLPIRKDFATQASYIGKSRDSIQAKVHQQKIRDQLQLSKVEGNENHKIILLMGGGEGVGSLSSIVECIYSELTLAHMNATVVVVCGRNDKLKTSLKERNWEEVLASYINRNKDMKDRVSHGLKEIASITKRTLSLRSEHEKGEKDDRNHIQKGKDAEEDEQGSNVIVHPLGFVNNMAEYMCAADILVTKAGPGTIAEAASVGLPVLLTSYLFGQEEGNVDFVIEKKFGAYKADKNPTEIAETVSSWLQNPSLLSEMSKYALEAGRPNAAEDIVRKIGKSVIRWKESHPEDVKGLNHQVSQVSC